ncbi:hypothetical protein A2U01_0115334, partial [Trifolium medium]|nr:hypothetical protein [Trifolium medium]
MAEACALYKAVQLAIECCFLDVIFESDNSLIVDLVKEGNCKTRDSTAPFVLET